MSSRQAAVASEVWSLLKDLVPPEEHDTAADAVVSMLLDNDCHLDDIAHAFADDSSIMRAVAYYRDDDSDLDEELDFDGEDDEW